MRTPAFAKATAWQPSLGYRERRLVGLPGMPSGSNIK
jgi:hypothetical protein